MYNLLWRNKAHELGHICRICHEPIKEKDWDKAVKNGQRCEACLFDKLLVEERRKAEQWTEYKLRKDGY